MQVPHIRFYKSKAFSFSVQRKTVRSLRMANDYLVFLVSWWGRVEREAMEEPFVFAYAYRIFRVIFTKDGQ